MKVIFILLLFVIGAICTKILITPINTKHPVFVNILSGVCLTFGWVLVIGFTVVICLN